MMSLTEVVPSSAASPGSLALIDGVAWLFLDEPDKRVNTLSSRLFTWFRESLTAVAAEGPRGLVVASAKPDGFVAGADLEELQALSQEAEVRALLERGHELLAQLEGLPFPTVAAIHGACLGGGLELALACDFRVASEYAKTQLGLPEVQLGLIPGLGGTQRLPRRIGVPDALDLILTGRQIDARQAKRLGLVDETCHPADLRAAALALLARGKSSPRRSVKRAFASRAGDFLARTPLGGPLVWEKARAGVLKKTGGHYPAPLAAIEVVRDGLKLPLGRAREVEAEAFAKLVTSETAKSLISIFFAKNAVEGRAAKLAKKARPVGTIGVLGAGFMGAGIAQVLAARGERVVLKDRDLEAVGRGYAFCRSQFEERVARRRMRPAEAQLALGRIHPTADYAAFGRADFVIEAVYEELEVKRRVIAEVEAAAPEGLIFASNTSAIPIAQLAAASRRPERVVGMHFFSPVAKMPLLEIIHHSGTSEEALATTVEIGRRMGKTVIVVGDGPGFFTSRVLGAMLNEAAWMLTEGVAIEEADRAMTRWGWPVGPFALLDEVGLDVAAHAGEVVRAGIGDRLVAPVVLARMLGDGRLGRKAKRGFYLYDGKEKRVDPAVLPLLGWQRGTVTMEDFVDRCWLQMLNETARCMEEKIIENPADVDLGVIFGFGFPPFRGGLLREADRRGLPWVVDRLAALAERHGERLAPAPLLRDLAERGAGFYPRP